MCPAPSEHNNVSPWWRGPKIWYTPYMWRLWLLLGYWMIQGIIEEHCIIYIYITQRPSVRYDFHQVDKYKTGFAQCCTDSSTCCHSSIPSPPGQAMQHFHSPKVDLWTGSHTPSRDWMPLLLSLIAGAPTPNRRHMTRVIGRDCQRDAASLSLVQMWRQHWRHTHGAPWRELDTPTLLNLFRKWNKQWNLVVYCASDVRK